MVDPGLNSLSTFRKQLHFRGTPGSAGGGSGKHGANAADIEIRVPRGTIIRAKGADEDTPPIAELLQLGEPELCGYVQSKSPGGRGGVNQSCQQTPEVARG